MGLKLISSFSHLNVFIKWLWCGKSYLCFVQEDVDVGGKIVLEHVFLSLWATTH